MRPGVFEILVIAGALIVVLVIFGPKRIAGMGKSLGEAIKGFRNSLTEREQKQEAEDPKSEEAESTPTSEKSV